MLFDLHRHGFRSRQFEGKVHIEHLEKDLNEKMEVVRGQDK